MARKKKTIEDSTTNEELKEFFEEVQKEKEKLEEETKDVELEITEEIKPVEVKEEKKEKKESKFKSVLLVLAFIFALGYYLLNIKDVFDTVEYVKNILNASLVLLLLFLIVIALLTSKTAKSVFTILSSLLLIAIVTLNILVNKDIIKLPVNKVLENYVNTSFASAMKELGENNIKVNSSYEYSDNVIEGNIISQDLKEGTLLKKIKEITFIVSSGPSLDKEMIISSWTGRTLDELLEYIDTNHLSNVTLNFETSNDYEKDIIISQSTKGEIKRNTKVTFTISLGNENSLKDTVLEDLVNKTEFDATLYLKRNAIKYEISYDFSTIIKKGNVISFTPSKGTTVKPKSDIVKLVISKGKEIEVLDFAGKSQDEVVSWAVDNNLKVTFKEKYSNTIEKDKVISLNYKAGDKIAEGTTVTVTTSTGKLLVPTLKNSAELRSWASQYNISYTERYEFNTKVARGGIVSLSIPTGSPIDPEKNTLDVLISNGSPISVPNFVGKSKSTIQSECSKNSLNCSFVTAGYNNGKAKDTALSQNVPAGRQVVAGTYITITLTKGTPRSESVLIQDTWLGHSPQETINTIKKNLSSVLSDVNFVFEIKAHNTQGSGLIHESSPIQAGERFTITQGQTYKIIVVE